MMIERNDLAAEVMALTGRLERLEDVRLAIRDLTA